MSVEINSKLPKKHTNILLNMSKIFFEVADKADNKRERDILKRGAIKSKIEGLIGQNPDPKDLKKARAESH